MPKRPITPADLLAFKFPDDPQLSPDGARVAFVVTTIEANKYRSHVRVDDRPFTNGPGRDSCPRWSPDGRWLAFVRTVEDVSQIHVLPADGGESQTLTRLPPGRIAALDWSPDSTRVAFTFRSGGKEKEPPVFRHITRLAYKVEGDGFLGRERFHVWVAWLRDGRAAQITEGDADDLHPAWSPDSGFIAFVSNRLPDADWRSGEQDLWIVPAGGGSTRRLPKPRGPAALPRWSPDGRTIAYLGHDRPEETWGTANVHVWTVAAHGRAEARDVTAGFDRSCEDLTVTDTKAAHGAGQAPVWSRNGKTLYFLASDHGTSHLYRVDAAGGEPRPVTQGAFEVMSFSQAADRFAMLISDPRTIGEVWVLDGGKRRRISRLNGELFDRLALVEAEEFETKAPDGERVHGWLLRPPHFTMKRRWPAVLQVHGGPRAQYGCAFFHEFQLLAAEGYVVAYTNPRGSQGYGEAHARAIVGDWGRRDFEDLMAATDALVAKPWIDARRLAVLGGSYGGWMTNWIVGHTDRFRCAVTMRCVSNFFSMAGTSDIAYDCHRELGAHAFDDPARYARMSPISFVKDMRTPLLILHAENDLRCPIEQAEQLFSMLKSLRRDVEFVRFPEENHDLSRTGRPDRRIARLAHILQWLGRHLGS